MRHSTKRCYTDETIFLLIKNRYQSNTHTHPEEYKFASAMSESTSTVSNSVYDLHNYSSVILFEKSLQEQRAGVNQAEKREEIMDEIIKDYIDNGQYRVTKADQRNIMLIGRTRTGKSTIKSLLVKPTAIPDDLTLKSGTRDPLFESFHVHDNAMVLNIIDTPGLFEHAGKEIDLRDNDTILRTIKICLNREITKFHVICFCIAITNGINQEDIESVQLLINFLGQDISRNSCLIVTRCESKNDNQRNKMRSELMEDAYFKDIAPYFQLGVFFSGSINRDDYNKGNESIYDQFFTISDYRSKLIKMFMTEIEPFPIAETLISQMKNFKDEEELKDIELKELQTQADKQAQIIEELTAARTSDKQSMSGIIDRLVATTMYERQQKERLQQQKPKCFVS